MFDIFEIFFKMIQNSIRFPIIKQLKKSFPHQINIVHMCAIFLLFKNFCKKVIETKPS